MTVHRIVNKTPDPLRATGYTYDGVNAWTANTCCFAGIPMAQADIASAAHTIAMNNTLGWREWPTTSMVQAWVDDPTANLGMLVNSDPGAAADTWRSFVSSDHATSARRPRLVVRYPGVPGLTYQLAWVDNAHNETGFYVQRRSPGDPIFSHVASLGVDVVQWVDAGQLAADGQYCYRVQAWNDAGESGFSNEACIGPLNWLHRPPVGTRPPATHRPPVSARPPIIK